MQTYTRRKDLPKITSTQQLKIIFKNSNNENTEQTKQKKRSRNT